MSMRCPVCSGNTAGTTVGCVKCQTPHHAECFGFLAQCAVFGCGGRTLGPVEPLSAAPLDLSDADRVAEPAPPAPPTRLTRGAVRRLLDTIQCLKSNARLALMVAVIGALFETLLKGPARMDGTAGAPIGSSLLLIVTLMAPVVLIVILAARARGKELTPGQHGSLVFQRLGRVIGTAIVCWVFAITAFLALATIAALPLVALAKLCGETVAGWCCIVLFPIVTPAVNAGLAFCSIAISVAAMGPEEEPGTPLTRARQIFAVDPGQATIGMFLTGLLTSVIVGIGGVIPLLAARAGASALEGSLAAFLGTVVSRLGGLLVPLYGALFYFEARRISPAASPVDPDSLDQADPLRPEVAAEIRSAQLGAMLLIAGYATCAAFGLMTDYAVGFGFGYAAASSYLLIPLPLAWLVTRPLYRRAALAIMRMLGPAPGVVHWARALVAAGVASATLAFVFQFVVVFVQGGISWFMTPAPSLMAELHMDVMNALEAAIRAGAIASLMPVVLCRRVPPRR